MLAASQFVLVLLWATASCAGAGQYPSRISREIIEAAISRRDVKLKNSTSLARSWNDATLLKFEHEQTVRQSNTSTLSASAGIEIVCTTCYLKGSATAEFSITGDPLHLISTTLDQVQTQVENLTQEVGTYFIDYASAVVDKFDDGIDRSDFTMPTFNYSFALDMPPIQDCNLRLQFDGLELYMLLDTTLGLGATYELNLWRSTSPLGIRISKDLELGVIIALDLILSVDGEVDISSGFHIQLNDGVALDIALFADEVSEMRFNGGRFEFLPVTLQSAGVVFSAILRVGVHAGFSLASPDFPELVVLDSVVDIPNIGGGVGVGVFANVAEFVTNVTVAPGEECELQVVQSYQFALGAKAGATVAIGEYVWGPVAETTVPIWYTEIADICAVPKTAVATPLVTVTATAAEHGKRQDLETITTTTKITYTGVSCISTGLVNCPASLQSTSRSIETRAIITAIPSGADFTLPASVGDVVATTVAFERNAISVPATTGSPVSYIPPPTPTSKHGGSKYETAKDKVSKDQSLVIGLACGLGIPFLMGICAFVIWLRRRHAKSSNSNQGSTDVVPVMTSPHENLELEPSYTDYKATKATVNVAPVGPASP